FTRSRIVMPSALFLPLALNDDGDDNGDDDDDDDDDTDTVTAAAAVVAPVDNALVNDTDERISSFIGFVAATNGGADALSSGVGVAGRESPAGMTVGNVNNMGEMATGGGDATTAGVVLLLPLTLTSTARKI